jgi:NADP-reducing hydrogenase subunit HndB
MLRFNRDKVKPQNRNNKWIKVGVSTCGIAAGAEEVFNFFLKEIKSRGIDIAVLRCGCAGKCYAEPLVEVKTDNMPAVIYGDVDKKTALEIIEKHIIERKLINDHIYDLTEVDDCPGSNLWEY